MALILLFYCVFYHRLFLRSSLFFAQSSLAASAPSYHQLELDFFQFCFTQLLVVVVCLFMASVDVVYTASFVSFVSGDVVEISMDYNSSSSSSERVHDFRPQKLD